MKTLVVATGNPGKLVEIRAMLGDGVTVRSLADYADIPEIIEDGDTFEANAIKKAVTIAKHTGEIALGDDSGLEVDALDGAPGIYSARFAGEDATDAANNEKLLALLENVPDDERTGRFRCVIAVATPDGHVDTASGAWEGRILHAPRGTNGFGYDPLFFSPRHGCASAELPPDEKNRASHRGQALNRALPALKRILEEA